MRVFDSGERVSGCGAPGPLFALDGLRCILRGGAFVVLIVTVLILRVRYDEFDSAMVQPANIRGVQTVTAGPGAQGPRVTASATLLRAAEHQPVGGAGRGLTERLLHGQNPLLQVESILRLEKREREISSNQ